MVLSAAVAAKNQLTRALSEGTVTQGFTKSNDSFNTLFYFLSKEIFAQIFFIVFVRIFFCGYSFKIFLRGFSFEYSFADFLANILSEYVFADFLSIMVMRYHIKIQMTGVLADGTITQGFSKSNESFNTLAFFLAKRIFVQIFFVDFLLNILSRIFFQIFIHGFSFSDFLSRIFFQIFFRGYSFKYGYAGPYKKSVDG